MRKYNIRRTKDADWWQKRHAQQVQRLVRLSNVSGYDTDKLENHIGRAVSLYEWFDFLLGQWIADLYCAPYANTQQQIADRARCAEGIRALMVHVDLRLEQEFQHSFEHYHLDDVELEEETHECHRS